MNLTRIIEQIKQIDESIEINEINNVITIQNYNNTELNNYISYLVLLFGKVVINNKNVFT